MVCFVILHYIATELTCKCIESILKLTGEKQIIVVDNASPNNSGEIIKKQYDENVQVDVIINKDNEGFARGNNVGYVFAKQHYNPDYIAILNNDVEINQKDFIARINEIYDVEHFHILGPDIYSTLQNMHQSPKGERHYSYEKLKELKKKAQFRLDHPLYVKFTGTVKNIDWVNKVYYKNQRKARQGSLDYSVKHYNVVLHGACVIFSKDYIQNHIHAFYPGTFMYLEMDILDYLCRRENLKVMYSPEIRIIHREKQATGRTYKKNAEKTIFMSKCGIQSYSCLMQLMEEDHYKEIN